MENELIFKIFRTEKQIHISSIYDTDFKSTITQPCFDYVIAFTKLHRAIKWRNENQNFENEYTIVPCY